jgi:DNA-directed RNA polymerase specialized sigma24 family protein
MAEAGMEDRDEDLLVRSASEPEAFSVFYERRAKSVLRYFAHRTFDPETAADLTAETFAQAFAARSGSGIEALARWTVRSSSWGSWAITSAG